MSSMKGQVALITGGGRGLGRSIGRALAAEGVAVTLDDVHRDANGVSAAQATADEIVAAGGEALALQEDVTTVEGTEAMVDAVVRRFGRLDILITCAGNFLSRPITELSEAEWDLLTRLHLKGHFLSCKAAVAQMQKQDYGRILTVASRGAFMRVPANKQEPKPPRRTSGVGYAAVKAGIIGFTTTLAVDLWDTGITVNCLLPSATTQLFPDTKPRMVGGAPATTSLDPDDVAPASVYLCSPAAADISGKVMYASGGDLIFFGDLLDMQGARMVRKYGRWQQSELAEVVPPLLGIPAKA